MVLKVHKAKQDCFFWRAHCLEIAQARGWRCSIYAALQKTEVDFIYQCYGFFQQIIS